jgi:capsular exopolysaccharide synthesis family protein
VLGLTVLLEARARRVADPEALSLLVPTEVFALPPLPTPRKRGWRKGGDGQSDRLEQYIQGLDHLRVALMGESLTGRGLGRCVLITSAVGGEGKTTLASQLATRCAGAGMSTLLIDADLRRAALSRIFDVHEDLGLCDVLLEEVAAESVLVPLQDYPFRLMPAGRPGADPGRVLQGKSFGPLIGQLRQAFDIIILDSPPVLPVPDALILGRWTEGVVLASRYEVSRLPLLEQARHRLEFAGIPLLGMVVNGVQLSSLYHQRYAYIRRTGHSSNSTPR